MSALFASVLTASLLGSLHCAAMCGAFVACGVGVDGRGAAVGRQAAYHLSRLGGYLGVGLVAGGFGALIDRGGTLVGVQRTAMLVAAATLVLFGALRLCGGRVAPPAILHRSYVALFGKLSRLSPGLRAAATGLLSAFLPCGWLYAFALVAAGAGSVGSGALVMFAFWCGTVPSLVVVGSGARLVAPRMQRHLPTLGAILLVLAGLYGLVARWPVPTLDEMRATTAAAETIPEAPACH